MSICNQTGNTVRIDETIAAHLLSTLIKQAVIERVSFPERKPIVKWIPPIPIGMDWKRELPTTVKMLSDHSLRSL